MEHGFIAPSVDKNQPAEASNSFGMKTNATSLLIKSGHVRLKTSPLKSPKDVFIEIYHHRIQLYDAYDNTILLKNYWVAASSCVQGTSGFELWVSGKIFSFVVSNYFEVDLFVEAIKQSTGFITSFESRSFRQKMPGSQSIDDDDANEDPSSFGTLTLRKQHYWFVKAFSKPTYCNVCRQALAAFQRSSLCCQICKIKIHKRCAECCSLQCKWTTLESCGDNVILENNEPKMKHQWVEGNMPFATRCFICSKKCGSLLRLQDYRCLWCRKAVHSTCLSTSVENKYCSLSQSKLSVLPPYSVKTREGLLSGGFQAVKPIASSPLIVFINLKSGSQEGAHFMRRFRQLLNPIQVNSLTLEGAAPGLLLCSALDSFRVLVCGGDGSLGWVVSEIDKLGLIHKCQVGILPLGTGNDLSRVLGWGSSVTIKLDISDIIKQMELAQIKMLDRWSVLSYSFPTSAERNDADVFTKGVNRAGIVPRTRRSPIAFVLRLEDQISAQLEDLSRLCSSFSTQSPFISVTCTNSDTSGVVSLAERLGQIQKRIRILPDLVHSFVSSIMSIGVTQRYSKSFCSEVATACDAIESRVQDLVRCWALIQSRSITSTTMTSESSARSSGASSHHTVNSQPLLSNPLPSIGSGYQQFLRIPHASPTPDLDSGCSSDFDAVDDSLALTRFATTTSSASLVRTMSSAPTPLNPVVILTHILRHLQTMIPRLSHLLMSNSDAPVINSNSFRNRCASAGRHYSENLEPTPVNSHQPLTPEVEDQRRKLSVPNLYSSGKAQSCGAIAQLSESGNMGDSGCSYGADDSFVMTSCQTPSPGNQRNSSSSNNTDSKPSTSSRFEKKNLKKDKQGIFMWPRSAVAAASSCTHLAPPNLGADSASTRKDSVSSLSALRSLGPTTGDGGFIKQMLYTSARALSSVCRQLMLPDPSLLHVTPASAPFEERCVMNNYFGIGLDARIALDFHIRREEDPASCKSRTINRAWFGVLGTKQFVQQTYRNLEQRVQLECDGERLLLPSLQGIVILNIPSYMGGVDFWGSSRASHGFSAPSFDDHRLEVVAIFGSAQLAASRVIRLHHHRIAQCRTVRITILDAAIPVQVDGEAWLHPPGVIVIQHKNRAQMLARDNEFIEVLQAWHRSSSNVQYAVKDNRKSKFSQQHPMAKWKADSGHQSSGVFLASPAFETTKRESKRRVTTPQLSRSSSDLHAACSPEHSSCD